MRSYAFLPYIKKNFPSSFVNKDSKDLEDLWIPCVKYLICMLRFYYSMVLQSPILKRYPRRQSRPENSSFPSIAYVH